MPARPGERFGRYELLKLLGSGAMGDVYAAHDTLLQRRVALKVLRTEEIWAQGVVSDESGARILREARAAARISHPNAVSVFDVGELEGLPFLVMELIDGTPLRAFIGDADVPVERRIGWLASVARGLAAAHALGIVHRDVKPDNVMVARDGVVKVLDFGIARGAGRQTDAPFALGTLTAEGLVLGTPLYMAPEQLRGDRIDGRADQFAWGVLAYELLTGKLPWDVARGAVFLASQILTHDPAPPRTLVPALPEAIDLAVVRALRKAPEERFERMDDVVAALEPFVEETASERAHAVLPPTLPGEVKATATKSDIGGGEPPRRSRARWPWFAGAGAAVALGAVAAWRIAVPARVAPSMGDAGMVARESRMSPVAEATAAYRAGLETEKNASLELARVQFDRAISLDPEFAAAHLRRALLADSDITDQMRQDLEKARNGRALLGDHDAALLDAVEPLLSVPPDLNEAKRRIDAALQHHPGDVDFAYQGGWTRYHADDFAGAADAFDALLAREPRLPLAWYMKGRSQAYGSSVLAPAIESLAHCLALSPRATSCLEDRAKLEAMAGDCRAMADTSVKLAEVAPDLDTAHLSVAEAKESLGAPAEEVLAALRLEWNDAEPENRSLVEAFDRESLAVLGGDFDEANRQNIAYEGALPAIADDVLHWGVTYERMLLALETGKTAEVLRLGREYLDRRAAWQTDDLGVEPTIYVYALEFQAGGLSRPQFAKLRDEWVSRDEKHVRDVGGVDYAGSRWAVAETTGVATPEDAVAAMAKRPGARIVGDALNFTPYLDEPVGRTLLLAGRTDEAITELSRVSGTCAVLEAFSPVFSTWATFDLGEAFEAKGDSASACTAYARVLARWGAAKPASRTATRALARTVALKCVR